MAECTFIESNQLNTIKSKKALVYNAEGQNTIKMNLLNGVKAVFGDKWNRIKDGTRKAIDRMAWFSSERGIVFAGQEYLAGEYGISDRTIRRAVGDLVEAGVLVVVYRRANTTNAKGTPMYLFTEHPYYEEWKELLNIEDVQEDVQEGIKFNPTESKAQEGKKVSTLFNLNKLRDLTNIAPEDSKGVLTTDQEAVKEILLNAEGSNPYWKDKQVAQLCAEAMPKGMTAVHNKALELVVKETLPKDVGTIHNVRNYFAKCIQNAMSRAEKLVNMCTWLDNSPLSSQEAHTASLTDSNVIGLRDILEGNRELLDTPVSKPVVNTPTIKPVKQYIGDIVAEAKEIHKRIQDFRQSDNYDADMPF